MRRIWKGPMALVAGAAVVGLGPAAQAQNAPLEEYQGVTVTPANVTAPGQMVTVAGPGFPGQQGCVIGRVLARVGEQPLEQARLFATGNLDRAAGWSFTEGSFDDGPFVAGTYSIFLRCRDDQSTPNDYSTGAEFTIAASAIPPPTTSTTTLPTAGQGTVDPTTAKPVETTITIRGGGFKPGATLQITLGTTPVTPLGSTVATDTGDYAATIKLPASAPPGNQQLVVTGPGPDDVARSTTASLTVQDLSCSDFATSEAAQAALGPGGSDPHGLDAERDGVACGVRSTGSARTAAGGTGTEAGSGGTAATGGTLPATGTENTSYGVVVGLAALTLGALLVGLSHPAVPASGQHRRRPARRR